jgi:predicted small lipoprotein YifL
MKRILFLFPIFILIILISGCGRKPYGGTLVLPPSSNAPVLNLTTEDGGTLKFTLQAHTPQTGAEVYWCRNNTDRNSCQKEVKGPCDHIKLKELKNNEAPDPQHPEYEYIGKCKVKLPSGSSPTTPTSFYYVFVIPGERITFISGDGVITQNISPCKSPCKPPTQKNQ